MEQGNRGSKERYWRNHISMAERFGGSLASYCRAQEISLNTFNYWRKKFAAGSVKKAVVASPFAGVLVERIPVNRGLPDPRWVADLILHLSDGAR